MKLMVRGPESGTSLKSDTSRERSPLLNPPGWHRAGTANMLAP